MNHEHKPIPGEQTLEDVCSNGDGTYNGAKALAWLSEVLHPGSGLSEAEVLAIWDDAKKKAKK